MSLNFKSWMKPAPRQEQWRSAYSTQLSADLPAAVTAFVRRQRAAFATGRYVDALRRKLALKRRPKEPERPRDEPASTTAANESVEYTFLADGPELAKIEAQDHAKRQKTAVMRDYKQLLYEELIRSTAHGWPNFVIESNLPLKVFWAFVIAASWSYFAYQFIVFVVLYSKYEVISSVQLHQEAPSKFPAVDICNINPYDGNVTYKRVANILRAKNISMATSSSAMLYTDTVANQVKSSFENMSLHGELDIYWAGFYLTQLLISCEFQGQPCSTADFSSYHDYNYGNCFRFNGLQSTFQRTDDYNYTGTGQVRTSSKPGWQNGLRLELNVGDPVLQVQYTPKAGVRVIIHNQSDVAIPAEDGIDVPTGYQTNLGLSRTFIERLGAPYSDCIDELGAAEGRLNEVLATLYEVKEAGVFEFYRQDLCIKVCYQYFIIKECKCMDLSLSFLNMSVANVSGCFSTADVNCRLEADHVFYNSAEVTECYAKCPVQCRSVEYDIELSMAAYPTQWYAALYNASLNDFVSYDDIFVTTPSFSLIKRSQLMLNVFYDTMTYTTVEQKPKMTFDQLFANVGASLILFSGMSLLSILEFLEIIVMATYVYYKHKKVRQL